MSKIALITGITGQDGSYLAELLLDKGYDVHGIKRRSSSFNTGRIDHIYKERDEEKEGVILHYGDLTDGASLFKIVNSLKPDEIYNLGAQSHVAVSFDQPEYTADVNALGTLRLLEAVRSSGLTNKTRFYQASSSELFGLVQETPQTETTPFYPRSPYATAKLFAFWSVLNYRESYGMFACNGILFNHESPRRGETFVTRKISRGLVEVFTGRRKCLKVGNMSAYRDWGHARDYVTAQWLMLQQEKPEDYVIATGQQYSVRDFITWTAEEFGATVRFEGSGIEERCIVTHMAERSDHVKVGDIIVLSDPYYYRPNEVDTLLGCADKARKQLWWIPGVSARRLCHEMVVNDLKEMTK